MKTKIFVQMPINEENDISIYNIIMGDGHANYFLDFHIRDLLIGAIYIKLINFFNYI